MRRFPFRNPETESWQDDSETVIYGDDLLEDVRPSEDDIDTLVYNERVARFSSSEWDDQAVEFLNSDVLEPVEPSAPSFSRPTLDAPILSRPPQDPEAAATAYFRQRAAESPLRRSSAPPPPLPRLERSLPPPAARAEMPTPVMDILPSLDAIRPESRPPVEPHLPHEVSIPPPPPIPGHHEWKNQHASAVRSGNAPGRSPHLDTLRPYSSSTSVAPPSAPPVATTSQWQTTSEWGGTTKEKLHNALAITAEAFDEVVEWAREMWSDVEANHRARGARPASFVATKTAALSFWRAATTAFHAVFNAHTATWGLGAVFLLLAGVAIKNPGASPRTLSATEPLGAGLNPIVLDGDKIEPVGGTPDVSDAADVASKDDVDEPEADDGDETEEMHELLDDARAGEAKAVSELKSRPPTSLSLEAVEALAIGQEALARNETTRIISQIAKKRRISAADRATFLRHVENPRTYREALLAMAENESWQGPDLIYLAMRTYRSNKDIVSFARALLLTDPIYKYASPALTVVIDAETMPEAPTSSFECQQVRHLAERAYEDADNRAVSHMARFARTTGCGSDGQEDCYPCLRDDGLLVDALRSAKGRRPPF